MSGGAGARCALVTVAGTLAACMGPARTDDPDGLAGTMSACFEAAGAGPPAFEEGIPAPPGVPRWCGDRLDDPPYPLPEPRAPGACRARVWSEVVPVEVRTLAYDEHGRLVREQWLGAWWVWTSEYDYACDG